MSRLSLNGWLLAALTVGLLALVLAQGADLRRFSNALGVAVFGLMVWRLTSTWRQLTVLEHVLGALLAASPLVSAVASLYLLHVTTVLPTNPWLWLIVLHRCLCLVVVAFWTHWMGRRVPRTRHRDPAF